MILKSQTELPLGFGSTYILLASSLTLLISLYMGRSYLFLIELHSMAMLKCNWSPETKIFGIHLHKCTPYWMQLHPLLSFKIRSLSSFNSCPARNPTDKEDGGLTPCSFMRGCKFTSPTCPNHGLISPEEEGVHHCSHKDFLLYGAQKDLMYPCCLEVALTELLVSGKCIYYSVGSI